MSKVTVATPRIKVRLYKTISRKTVDGQTGVSARYEGKSESIDLTPFLNDRSSVRVSKSVREPAGAFSIAFADKADKSYSSAIGFLAGSADLESVYGLVEPMDIIEIRIWNGLGPAPDLYPIAMRGFVSEVQRQQAMGSDGRPQRQVVISGQDYGKIWQMYQVIYLAAYAEGKPLLTNFALWDLFGLEAQNTMPAGDFVRKMISTIINPHIKGFIPENKKGIPRELIVDLTSDSNQSAAETARLNAQAASRDGISVKHGVINNSYQNMQGSVYDILKFHGDVGVWNELYTEDREDGVHVVYRPIPALHLSAPAGQQAQDGQDPRKIQDDAPNPVYVDVPASQVQTISTVRSDANVANFFWVDGSRYDLITDLQSRLQAIPANDARVSLKDYPNSAQKYYGVRPMYATTQQGEDSIKNATSGQSKDGYVDTSEKMERWIDKRRRLMLEMNRDNVVLERGVATIKGGPMRSGGVEMMKAGDYARFQFGSLQFEAYVVQIEHNFMPFQSYTTSLTFERGTGFVERTKLEGGIESPWLAEQATPIQRT